MDHATFGFGDMLMQVVGTIANGTAYSPTMELSEAEQTHHGKQMAPFEFRIGVPELTATEISDKKTLAFALQFSDDPTFANGIREITDSLAIAVGSGTDGFKGEYFFFKCPYKRGRYVRVKTVGDGLGTTSKKYTLDYMV